VQENAGIKYYEIYRAITCYRLVKITNENCIEERTVNSEKQLMTAE
jgi:hypothetical protein